MIFLSLKKKELLEVAYLPFLYGLIIVYFLCLKNIFAAWCPYQAESIVACKIRNGTEQIYGPTACGRSELGSIHCSKTLIRRPRYVTVLKRVQETKYKCCPAFEGSNCDIECINCELFKKLSIKVKAVEDSLQAVGIFNKNNSKSVKSQHQLTETTFNESKNKHFANHIMNSTERDRMLEKRIAILESQLDQINKMIKTMNLVSSYGSNPIPLKDKASMVSQMSRKAFEDNLARGDIASTLNDDYGEDQGLELSANGDEYSDQLRSEN